MILSLLDNLIFVHIFQLLYLSLIFLLISFKNILKTLSLLKRDENFFS
jgi:hypothetical protein